ncbi:MAG TPA: crosslink repair DNA glycosylase YcaQ family protein, partial [Kofleriaceae bacterium]|nr:crosslink repair DNA glycosylase YcaQ family protein [Kofleriaceae bacterium]
QDELDSHTIGDVTYWHGKLAKPKGSLVHLLSAWDEYTVGYRDRAAILDPSHVTSTLNALAWVFTVDGRVAGVWKRETKRTGIAVTLAPFAPLERKTQRSADEAIARYQAYLAS